MSDDRVRHFPARIGFTSHDHEGASDPSSASSLRMFCTRFPHDSVRAVTALKRLRLRLVIASLKRSIRKPCA